MKNRIISLVLTLSLCVSLLVLPAHAEYVYNPIPPSDAATFWNALSGFFGFGGLEFIDSLILPTTGRCSKATLEQCCDTYNGWLSKLVSGFSTIDTGGFRSYSICQYDPANDIYRLQDTTTKMWVCDSQGRFPYVESSDWSGGVLNEAGSGADVPATPSISNNHWVGERSLANQVVLITYDSLSECVVNLNNEGYTCSIQKQTINGTTFYVIKDNGRQVYCNSLNQPFASKGETSATDIKYDYITNDNSTTINDSQVIDMADGILNVINENGERTELYIDQITFDFDNRQYTLNAYNYVYNTTNNYYEYHYYTYNVSYTYNYTYINYIGSTVEFQPEEYKLYYELPDGRTSADLTAEEIAGLSLDFDVVNYDRAYTDTHTQSLYHFDGNWSDDSYYSNSTSLAWISGASITYMDANAFSGAMYLDSLQHEFKTTYPTALSGDHTVQYRMYFGGQGGESPFVEYNYAGKANKIYKNPTSGTYSYIGWSKSYPVLAWDSTALYIAGSWSSWDIMWRKVCDLPLGSWVDIAYVCSGSDAYVFVNGVRYAFPQADYKVYTTSSGSTTAKWTSKTFHDYSGGKQITWYFHPGAHSFYYLDELRIVDFAVYTSSYQPSPVPFDTNNVFVLPDSSALEPLTIAVQHDTPVSGYRVGGVRPTFPSRGMVFFPVEKSRITDCQIYNGSYWESVECRLWTGSRWIPLWAFDVTTLQDLWDMADQDVQAPITTETGFWSWWQSQWLDFRAWLSSGGSIGGSGTTVDPTAFPTEPPDPSDPESSGWSFLDLLKALKDGTWKIITGVVGSVFGGVAGIVSGVVSVGDYFDAYDVENPDGVLGIVNYGGEDIWD